MVTAGSAFSGIGGMDLAAATAGIDIRWQIENDKFSQRILKKHSRRYWPNAKRFTDIRFTRSEQLQSIDIIFGGFPCQDVSKANNKRETVSEGKRTGLWSELCRIISDLRPRAILLENVEGILSAGASDVLADLAALDYMGQSGIISAADAGFPFKRERWFVVGFTSSFGHIHKTTTTTRQNQADKKRDYSLFAEQRHRVSDAIGADDTVHRENEFTRQSRVGNSNDGVPEWMVRRVARWNESQNQWEAPRITTEKDSLYSEKKRALGNAVIPAQIYPVFKLIVAELNRVCDK